MIFKKIDGNKNDVKSNEANKMHNKKTFIEQ